MARPVAEFLAGDFLGVFRIRGAAFFAAVLVREGAGFLVALPGLVFDRGAAFLVVVAFRALLSAFLRVVLGALFFFTGRFPLEGEGVDCFEDFDGCAFLVCTF